ncbi:MAG: hypothetical protein WC517_01830 [Patescibacteria group bacterium]
MLSTSQDLLWVALAFAILWIGIATGFACFYLALILRNAWLISKSIRKKVEAIEKIISAFKGKVENTASYIPPLIEGISKIVEAVKEKGKSDEIKRQKKKK